MRALGVAILLAAALTATGCDAQEPPTVGFGGPNPAVGDSAADALAAWRDFPADRHPRPVVLLGDPAVVGRGFADVAGKEAFAARSFTLTATAPAAPNPTARVQLPDGAADLPIVAAADAFTALSRSGLLPGSEPKPSSTYPPLVLDRVSFGTAEFRTDRGAATLPAWLFSGPGLLDRIAWPAVAPEAIWHLGALADSGRTGRVSPDGRTLTLHLPEAPTACDDPAVTYHAVALTSRQAVAVHIEPTRTAAPTRANCAGDDMLRLTDYDVTLTEPLGGRVVLGPNGSPIAISA
ncbi:hypothetical protein ACFO1B_41395 [Dactylosporangium siamense]|nr:hypothetical protein [Dactylosporangium siamense]